MPLGRIVVVPIVSPITAPAHIRIAAHLAKADGGTVVPLTVVARDADASTIAAARELLASAEAAIRSMGVVAEGMCVEDDSVAEGVLDALAGLGATLGVMGWQGRSTTGNVFGRLIDTVAGRSGVPLAVVRPGSTPPQRLLLPVADDNLNPLGRRGLDLTIGLARRLQPTTTQPVTIVRAGANTDELPPEFLALSDRMHHDHRRIDQAVAASARREDLIITSVAPTATGLRNATTHMAWAAPGSTLVVAVDVGSPPDGDLTEAVRDAGAPAPPMRAVEDPSLPHTVSVLIRLREHGDVDLPELLRELEEIGALGPVDRREGPEPTLETTVTVEAPLANAALGRVMTALHETNAVHDADITYSLLPVTAPSDA